MKQFVAALFRVPLFGPAVQALWQFARRLVLHHGTAWAARRHLRTPGVRKLHLGAGGAGLPGWFNTDLFPERWPVMRLDATRSFPLPDAAFQFVFSEHMIEHLPLAGARHMVAECFRVLAPGGCVRLATPDLARVVRLHPAASTPEHQRYLAWSQRHNRLAADLPPAAVVINSLFHDHGHQFLFDEETLATLLRLAGFTDIRRCVPGESEHAELRGVEIHHLVIGVEANNFETLVLEGRKP
ncbi:MAG: class I SAM-dependent methyltransferase [Verrucomicrobia bacterium]|nr:class I SAM-dependent methyltransferase [Verrucomicrobiota bacterium]